MPDRAASSSGSDHATPLRPEPYAASSGGVAVFEIALTARRLTPRLGEWRRQRSDDWVEIDAYSQHVRSGDAGERAEEDSVCSVAGPPAAATSYFKHRVGRWRQAGSEEDANDGVYEPVLNQ
jgi:hypothetical protein